MDKVIQAEKLRKYLLGTLKKSEADEIDLELISSDKIEEELFIAEDLLIEDYLEKNLSKAEEKAFHKNFLISAERHQQLTTIAQLKKYSQSLDTEKNKRNELSLDEPNFIERILKSFQLLPVQAFASFLVVGLIGMIVFAVYVNSSNSLTSQELAYENKNNSKFVPLSKYEKKHSSLLLSEGLSRAEGELKSLNKADLTKDVFFHLPMETDEKKSETFRIELYFEETLKFTLKQKESTKNEAGIELRFLLPRTVFDKKGVYKIKVQSNKNENNKITYLFLIK